MFRHSTDLTVVSKGKNRDQGPSVICFGLRCYNANNSRRGVDCTDREA